MRHRYVSALLILAGCTPGEGGSPWDDPLPGTVVLLDSPEVTHAAVNGDVGYPTPTLTDLVRDGGSLYGMATIPISGSAGAVPILLTSTDEGTTWTQQKLPRPDLLAQGDLYGLHVVDGRGALVAHSGEERGGTFYDIFKVIGLDVTTGTYTSNPNDMSNHVVIGEYPQAAGRMIVGVEESFEVSSVRLFAYDVATGTASRHDVMIDELLCSWRSDDGATGAGWCTKDVHSGGVCRHQADLSGTTATVQRTCVEDAWLPYELTEQRRGATTHRGHLGISSTMTGVAAYELDPQGLRIFDLGPGERPYPTGFLGRPFGDLIMLSGSNRLVEVAADGTVSELDVPRSPCANDTRCGVTSALVRLLPLGGDRYGAVWLVDRGKGGSGGDGLSETPGITAVVNSHRVLYYRVITVSRTAVPQQLPMYTAPMLRYPGAIEATAVEKACTAARMCWAALPGRPIAEPAELSTCEHHWSRRRVAPGETDVALDRFLAAPLGDCDALMSAWPAFGLWGTPGCQQGACVGEVAVRSCVTSSPGVNLYVNLVDCGETGMGCREYGGFAHCVDPSFTPGDVPACDTCDGDIATSCSSGGLRTSLDCAAMGGTCQQGTCQHACTGSATCLGDDVALCSPPTFNDARPVSCATASASCSNGQCVPDAVSEQCVAAGINGLEQCAGNRAVRCVNKQIHWMDCTDLGAVCMQGSCLRVP